METVGQTTTATNVQLTTQTAEQLIAYNKNTGQKGGQYREHAMTAHGAVQQRVMNGCISAVANG